MSDPNDPKKAGAGAAGGGSSPGATSPGGTETSGTTIGSPGTTVVDSPGGDSSAPTTLAPGEDDEGLQRMIRANTVTDADFQYEAGTLPSIFQSLADARSANHSKYSAAGTFQMEKRYNLFSCICVIVCVVIGSGIFINAQDAVKNTKSPGAALILWFFMGVHSTIGALCYAELGTTLPVSGGDYAYINEAFGSFLAFLYQWCSVFLFIPAVNAILCKTVSDYLLNMIFFYAEVDMSLMDNNTSIGNTGGPKYKLLMTSLNIILLLCVTIGNCLTTKFAEKLQNILTVTKLSACAMIILGGIYVMSTSGFATSLDPDISFADNDAIYMRTTTTPSPMNSTNGTSSNATTAAPEPVADNGFRKVFDIGAGVYDVYFSYLGWTYLNFITEELQDPYRNLPIAIVIALPLITGVYCLMNLSYLAILKYETLVTTKVVASTALGAVFGSNPDVQKGIYWIAPCVVIFSAFGALVGHVMATARVLYVAPRFNHAPTVFNQAHPTRMTPIPSLVVQAVMSILYIIMQNFTLLILMSAYCETSFTCIAIMGLVYLRFKYPELERPMKFWIGMPIIFITISVILFLIIPITIIGDWDNPVTWIVHVPMFLGPFVVVAFGSLAYLFFRQGSKTPSPECRERTNNKLDSIGERLFKTRRPD